MKNKLFLGLVATLFVAVFTSCDKLPQAEIDAANNAVEQAKVAGADIYLADQYLAVQDSLKLTMEKIEVQKSKMFRSYDEPKKQLAVVTEMAVKLQENTEIRKEEVKNEVLAAIEEVKNIQAENNTLLVKAPKGKEGAAALESIKSEMGVIDASLTEISALFDKGEYMSALDKVKASKEKAAGINEELKSAIAKVTKARR